MTLSVSDFDKFKKIIKEYLGSDSVSEFREEYVKEVPVSIIGITNENREYFSKIFSFSLDEKYDSINAKIQTGSLDQVTYNNDKRYFDSDGLLKIGTNIMIQSDSDIYLTEKTPKELGYEIDIKSPKVNFTNIPEKISEEISKHIVVQKKYKPVELDSTKKIFEIFTEILMKNPEIKYEGEHIQILKEGGGYIAVDKEGNSTHIINSNGNDSLPAGYIKYSDLKRRRKIINSTKITLKQSIKELLEKQETKLLKISIKIEDQENSNIITYKFTEDLKSFKNIDHIVKKFNSKDISYEEKERLLINLKELINNLTLVTSSFKYTTPQSAVDLGILINVNGEIKIPVIERKFSPKGLAFPGGMIDEGETEQQAVIREIEEELSIKIDNGNQLKKEIFVNGKEHGDPRGDISTSLYSIMIHGDEETQKVLSTLKAGDDASSYKLYSIEEMIKLLKSGKFCKPHEKLVKKLLLNNKMFLSKEQIKELEGYNSGVVSENNEELHL